jgi:hypothetical protein
MSSPPNRQLGPLETEFAKRWKVVGARLKNGESLESILEEKPHLRRHLDPASKNFIPDPGPPLEPEKE